MIIRPKLHWFRMLFVWRGSVLPQLLPRLGLIFTLSVAAISDYAPPGKHTHSRFEMRSRRND